MLEDTVRALTYAIDNNERVEATRLLALVRAENDADDASMTGYERRKREETLAKLSARVAALSKPQRLVFKRAAKPVGAPDALPSAPATTSPSIAEPKRTAQYIRIDTLDGTSTLTLTDLDLCFVDLLPLAGKLSTLHLRSLDRCVVLAPVLSGSAMLHSCSHSLIVLGAHQLRIHDSVGSDLHILTASAPIIERCASLQFAEYPVDLTQPVDGPKLQVSEHRTAQDFDDPLAAATAGAFKWSPIPASTTAARTPSRFGLDTFPQLVDDHARFAAAVGALLRR